MQTHVRKFLFNAGEPSAGFNADFARVVYDNCAVFQHRNFDEFFISTSLMVQNMPRSEYIVYDENGSVVASMAFYREYDMHVGDCLSVLLAFSTDPKYLIGGYRWLFDSAKTLGVPFVAYTKETKPFEYSLVYRKVK